MEIASDRPYSYYDSGFSSGVIGFYFSAADDNLPAWGTANLSIEIIGDPTIDWDDEVPYISSNSFNWATSSAFVAIEIRSLAQQLQNEWTSIDLLESISGINKLTDEGETYFDNSIPNLRLIADILYSSTTDYPVYTDTSNVTTYQEQLQAEILATSTGNVTALATDIGGISPNTLLTLMWAAGGIAFIGILGVVIAKVTPDKIATFGAANIIRSSLVIFCVWMIFGTVTKFVILQAGIGLAAVAVLGIVFTFFYRGSSY